MTLKRLSIVAVLLVVLGSAGALASACTPETLMELRIYAGVNQFRTSQGLPELRADADLARVAKFRSQDMIAYNYFGHTNPVNGSTAFTTMSQWGIPFAWAAENIAWNSYADDASPGVVMNGWQNSPTHRANMLGGHYDRMGVGVATAPDGKKYYTLVLEGNR